MKYFIKVTYISLFILFYFAQISYVFAYNGKEQEKNEYPRLVFREKFEKVKDIRNHNKWIFYNYRDKTPRISYDKYEKAVVLENKEYGETKFVKKFIAKKDNFYYLSAMIKTENVEEESKEYNIGANIGDNDEYYPSASESMIGSKDWKRVGVIIPPGKGDICDFFSQINENVSNNNPMVNFNNIPPKKDGKCNERTLKIALRLGHHQSKVSGKAWFKDVRIYDLGGRDDIRNNPNPEPVTWRVLAIICKDVNSKELISTMTKEQIEASKNAFIGYKKMLEQWSKGYLKIDLHIRYAPIPLESTSPSKEYKLVADEKDISKIVGLMARPKEYDAILVSIPIPMERREIYAGLAFPTKIYSKNIRTYYSMFTPYDSFTNSLQDKLKVNMDMMFSKNSYDYILNHSYGVVIHEWLHQLEFFFRNDLGFNEIPVLHDHKKYGYDKNYKWYRDFIGFDVIDPVTGERKGVPPPLWKLTPRMF